MSARPLNTVLAALERCGCKLTREQDGWRTSCPSPNHAHGNRRNPALSLSEGADGRALVCCHAGCSVDDVLGALGLEPVALFPDGGDKTSREPKKPARGEQGAERNREHAARLLREAKPIAGTPVAGYLLTRGLSVPKTDALRFHPRLEYWQGGDVLGMYPGMVALVVDAWGAGLGVHRTFLEGPRKARVQQPKKALGNIGGGAVRLFEAGDVVALAEGIETALAVHELSGLPTWATISSSGMKRLELPETIREVVIAADPDEAGRNAARTLAERLTGEGRAVRIVEPPAGGDFLDWLHEHKATPEDWRELLAKAQPFRAEEKRDTGDLAASGVVRLADVQPERIEWLWPGRIAIGKLTLFAGDPGLGKSLLTAELAAHVTRGRSWPVDGSPCPKGAVLMLSVEDDLADTIRPRLDAAGADPARVFALPMVRDVDAEGRERRRVPSLVGDLERIEAMLMQRPEIRLVTIDPVSAYLPGVDSYKNTDMRAVLAPWADMAARRRVALVCVSHLNKGSGQAIYRTAGSIAFTAAARAVFGVTKDAEDEARRLVVPVKNNLGKDAGGLAYRVREADNGAPRIEWEPDAVHISADEAMAWRSDDEHRTATDEAVDFLREVLADGPVKAKDVHLEARNAGISDKALRRARERLGIKPRKQGGHFGKNAQCWVWSLPDDDPLKMPPKTEDAHSMKGAPSGDRGIFSEDCSPAHGEKAAPGDPFADVPDDPDFLPPDVEMGEAWL